MAPGPPEAPAPPAGRSRASARRYGFLLTARWLRVAALALTVSLACAAAGTWQWNRHSARLEAVPRVQANYDADPTDVAALVPGPGAELSPEDEWRPVRATGAYAPGGTVLLRNRPVSGTPALHVLAVFVVAGPHESRSVLVIDRGWLPAGSEEFPETVPDPPSGTIDVLARLRPAEEPDSRTAPPGQAYAIEPAQVLAASNVDTDVRALPVLAVYGVLASEDPAAATAPRILPPPDTDLGTHLSYTFQWWVFAIGAIVGFGVLARREAAAQDHEGAGHAVPDLAPSRTPPQGASRRRRGSAEEEEDALIDAQLASERSRSDPRTP